MNVSMKKIVIAIVALLIICGSAYWWNSTKDERAEKAGIKTMVDYAQRQALEIAIIEQASKLTDYRKQLENMKQVKTPVTSIPELPVVPDPKDVDVNR